jgi:putative acetyltransferase
MNTYILTNAEHADFKSLVEKLDLDLKIRDGDDHDFYAQLNKTDSIKLVIVFYDNELPVGCGAIRQYDEETMEVKRMYVLPERRGIGIASEILGHLEQWAFSLNFRRCILETGINQPEAIALYKKNGYKKIANYGHYKNIENSVCFEKALI